MMCLIAFVKHLQPLLPRLTTLEFLNPLVMMTCERPSRTKGAPIMKLLDERVIISVVSTCNF